MGLLLLLLPAVVVHAQKKRYVQQNSIHALSVPDNPDYSFHWTINNDLGGMVNVPGTSNVTHNIQWTELTTYHVSVMPMLDSVSCYGEAVSLDVVVVEYLSLHTFDDIYFTAQSTPVSGNVGENDVDETGAGIYFTPTPVIAPQHGSLDLLPDGSFTYTPEAGFTGIDEFVYEAYNDHEYPMYSNARVSIVVQPANQQADVEVKKTGPEKALFGEDIRYRLIVSNKGPATARNVTLVDTLAFGLFDPLYRIDGDWMPWEDELALGDLPAGDSVVVYIEAHISDFSPGMLFNQGLGRSETYDPVYRNNDSIWITRVSAIYVDLPGYIYVPSCETYVLPGNSNDANLRIQSYQWLPATGLSDPNIADPVFTPDTSTIGKTTMYILQITDIEGHIAADTTYIVVPEVPVASIEADTMVMDRGTALSIHGGASTGDGLQFEWQSNDGSIVSFLDEDSIVVESIGHYYLTVTDNLGCTAIDSVVVLYESHPPLAENDWVEIVAGTDSTINVLSNDSDINLFDLEVSEVVTPPLHTSYSWNADGSFTLEPDAGYWQLDSLEYRVCNNGYPVQCSTAWIFIDSKRPPLNTDMNISKSGPEIAFRGDTIEYRLVVSSAGPDTSVVTTVYDYLNEGFYNAQFSIDGGQNWKVWPDSLRYTDSIRPGEDVLTIDIRANVRANTDRFIENTAWVVIRNMIENNLEDDTARVTSKMKELVLAEAGRDTTLGSCADGVLLDGTASTGENLTYRWSPSTHLSGMNSAQPYFTVPPGYGAFKYYLTITDDDGISDTDSVTINVLPPPLADAGEDLFLEKGDTIALSSAGSSGMLEKYFWHTNNGYILPSTINSKTAATDTIGTYYLTVTDSAGCSNTDSVNVYWYYYPPFAIPDYYSTRPGTALTGENVLDNDHNPNEEDFLLTATPGLIKTVNGGNVVMQSDGSFRYTPPLGFNNNVDAFSYEVCNDAVPPRCSYGYVQITVNNPTNKANLNITKEALNSEVLIGKENGAEFRLSVINHGPDEAANVTITDSLSQFFRNAQYNYRNSGWRTWDGDFVLGTLAAGDSTEVLLRATATNDAPGKVFNAATVASRTYDDWYDWGEVENRNVDTASVKISSDLIAEAQLVEMLPSDKNHGDATLGFCDNLSYLSAEGSESSLEMSYEWSPAAYVMSPNGITTKFRPPGNDTTIVFTLTVQAGYSLAFASVEVRFSEELIADAGPDRKINVGETLTIDGTGSSGAGAVYSWYQGSREITSFEGGNPLMPIVDQSGSYELYAEDQHGCTADDQVFIRENNLFVVSDFIVVVANDTLHANVRTNDYDPNGDSIYYTSIVFDGPFNGTLLDHPFDGAVNKSALATPNKISEGGWFSYVPDADFTGYDYFTYEVCDDNDPDLCIRGMVYIRVIDVVLPNSPPLANPDYLFVNRNDTVLANVMHNDYDFDGGRISMSEIVVEPSLGTAEFVGNGMIRYIPDEDVSGIDHLVYRICDNNTGNQLCDTARVTINIHKIEEENHRPVAVDDAFYVVEKEMSGNLLRNDYDPDGNQIELVLSMATEPLHGRFRLNSNGDFTYQPDLGFEGTDQMTYVIRERNTDEGYEAIATVYFTSLAEERYVTDLALVKTAPAEAVSGSTIVYRLDLSIDGPTLANDIVLSDTLYNELSNWQYSFDSLAWSDWQYDTDFEQMMLYDDTTLYVRARIPVRYAGDLVNIAWVEHDMNELDEENNRAEATTHVYQQVIADAGRDTILGSCAGVYLLDATASVGLGQLQYKWSPAHLLDDPTSATPGYAVIPEQTVEFTVVVSSSVENFSGSDTARVLVQVAEEPVARAGNDINPDNSNAVLLDGSASTGSGAISYLWWTYDEEGNVVEVANTPTVTVDKTNSYFLTVTDQFGCTHTDRMNVTYPIDQFIAVDDEIETWQQMPVDIYVLRNDIIDEDDDYDLDLLIVSEEPSHGTIVPRPYDSLFTYIPEPYFTGRDTFVYIATTKNYSDQAMVTILVKEKPPVVPDAFSPNGDGINDFLLIENIELYEENTLVIFNRWGNIVYESTLYSNDEPWDGVANSGVRVGTGPLPPGVYFYILDLGNDDRLNQRIFKGNIYIASDNRR